MAPRNALYRKPEPFEYAVFLEGFHSIMRTGRSEPAFRTNQWRQHLLVYPDESDKRVTKYFYYPLHLIHV